MTLVTLSEVPGCPGWRYGLAVRGDDKILTVTVYREDGEQFIVTGSRYWHDLPLDGEPEGIHTRAARRIAEIEARAA